MAMDENVLGVTPPVEKIQVSDGAVADSRSASVDRHRAYGLLVHQWIDEDDGDHRE